LVSILTPLLVVVLRLSYIIFDQKHGPHKRKQRLLQYNDRYIDQPRSIEPLTSDNEIRSVYFSADL